MFKVTDDVRFMRNTGDFLLALTVLAFTPKYFGPIAAGTYDPPSRFMHPHAVTALLWTRIFILQPSLVALGRPTLHRRAGYVALLIAVVNIATGIAVQLDMLPTAKEDFSNVVGGGFRLFHSLPAFAVFLVGVFAAFQAVATPIVFSDFWISYATR